MPDGTVIWFTGHSKSGKTTLARLVEEELRRLRVRVFRIDSDTVPAGIIKPEGGDWEENQRRKNENLVFLAGLLAENGYHVLISSVGRYSRWRETMRAKAPRYLEIYLKCPIEVRLQRDTAGKYESHQAYFSFYEEPLHADLIIETNRCAPREALERCLRLLRECGVNP